MPDELTHFDATGASRMVDVGGKPETLRTARASGIVRMAPATWPASATARWPRATCWKWPGWPGSWPPNGRRS